VPTVFPPDLGVFLSPRAVGGPFSEFHEMMLSKSVVRLRGPLQKLGVFLFPYAGPPQFLSRLAAPPRWSDDSDQAVCTQALPEVAISLPRILSRVR